MDLSPRTLLRGRNAVMTPSTDWDQAGEESHPAEGFVTPTS